MTTTTSQNPNNKAGIDQTQMRYPKTVPIRVIFPRYAQALFLEAVADLAPEALKSLHAGPYQILAKMSWPKAFQKKPSNLPTKANAIKSELRILSAAAQAARSETIRKAMEQRPQFPALRQSIDQWAKEWNLTGGWCKESALTTIIWWRLRNSPNRRWYPSLYAHDNPLQNAPPFKFAFPTVDLDPPDPRVEVEAQYKRKLLRQFNKQVKVARTRVVEECEKYLLQIWSAGKTKSMELQKPVQFLWLAGFQVRGWSYYQIAKSYGKSDKSSIRKQIKKLAGSIGLKLRSPLKNDHTQDAQTITDAMTGLKAWN